MSRSIILNRFQLDWAADVGRKREGNARHKGLRGGVGLKATPEESAALHLLGARSELAAFLWLGGHPYWQWNFYRPGTSWRHLPDVVSDRMRIDVKSALPHKTKSIIVAEAALHNDWVYLLVDSDACPVFKMLGYAYGCDIRNLPVSAQRPSRWLHQSNIAYFHTDVERLRHHGANKPEDDNANTGVEPNRA
jgi:hypothetical protein